MTEDETRLQTEPVFRYPTEKPLDSSPSLLGENLVNGAGRRTPENHCVFSSFSEEEKSTPPSIGSQQLSPPHNMFAQPNTFVQPNTLLNAPLRRPPRPKVAGLHDRGVSTGGVSAISALTDPLLEEEEIKQLSPPHNMFAHPNTFVQPNTLLNAPLGRPPRPKVAGLHDRGVSTGGVSAISALTDPLLEEEEIKRPRPIRKRGVSWDMNVAPIEHYHTRLQEPSIILQPPVISNEESQSSSRRLQDKLAMADIVSPIECEAETAIMKALEDRERSNMVRSTGAAILPNLPDEAAASLQDYASMDDRQAAMMPISPASPPESTSNLSKASLNSHESKASLEKQKSKAALLEKQNRHRRTNTSATAGSIETTLYSLAAIMRNIHQEQGGGADETEHVMASHDIGYFAARDPVEVPMTQSDALANHAALLFRGKINEPHAVVVDNTTANEETDPKKNDDLIMEGENGNESSRDQDIELGTSGYAGSGPTESKRTKRSRAERLCHKTIKVSKEDWEMIEIFLGDQKKTTLTYIKHILLWLILPATSVAAILYYGLSNPSMSVGYDVDTKSYPSVSWFILFLCVRQVITLSLAKVTEVIIIDFVALKTRLMLRILGPLVTLVIVQSKGWPFTFTWWAVYDLSMLSGKEDFANHWVYYQNLIGLFNAKNPSGAITSNIWNYRILIAILVLGIVVAFKRFIVGLYLGGRQYSTYGSKLAIVINKMIVISQVASLARQLEKETNGRLSTREISPQTLFSWNFRGFDYKVPEEEDEATDDDSARLEPSASDTERPYRHSLRNSEKFKLAQMLHRWEEPPEEKYVGNVSIRGILQFKQTLAFMDLSYPFSRAFGLADSRENCAQSAEEIYRCLLLANPHSEALQFETLSALARTPDSEQYDETRLKDLVKTFRPERDGTLCKLEFVRSIDRVYKDLRLLRASIRNSSHIDQAFEAIINVGFYFIVFCVVLLSWGINPLTMFLSLSSVILAFSFAIGSASAKYFEGLMFILLRNPYDIGDRISIDSPFEPCCADGVFTWYVEDVTLYYTTVRLGATNEVATIANSSLANSRIVNAARSHKALIYITLKFGLDVPYAKIQIFKTTVESFIKARPREWLDCYAIRSTRVEADLGFVEYVIALQHRDSWQHICSILESKAAVMSFCLEVQKKLGMRYTTPSTPVDLTMKNAHLLSSLMQGIPESSPVSIDRSGSQQGPGRDRTQSTDLRGIASMFAIQSG